MEAYKKWIRSNKHWLKSLHSLANGLTWVLPETLFSSEIGPEAVTSILGIITTLNEHVIDTTPIEGNVGSLEPSPFPYSLCISTLKELEPLVEVASEQYYGDRKWDFIAITEAIKVAFRLVLFRNSGYKMLLQGGETPNVDDEDAPSRPKKEMEDLSNPGRDPLTGSSQNCGAQNPENLDGKAMSALSRFGENTKMASDHVSFRRVQPLRPTLEPPSLVVLERPSVSSILSEKGFIGALFMMGEVLSITRPFVYLLLIKRYGIRSWIPWLLSLAVDLLGMGVLLQVKSSMRDGKGNRLHLSIAEKNEIKRRKLLWAFYLMRDPFFTKYTGLKLENAKKIMEPVPIVGLLTEKIVELIVGAQSRYTYMSGS